jgi:MFS family permease
MMRSHAPAPPTDVAAHKRDRLLTPRFLLLVGDSLLYFIAIGMLLPVLPLYVRGDLDGSDLAVGISVGAFAVGALALRPVAGRLGDRYGRRILIVGGALVVAVSVACYAPANTIPLVILTRVLTGAGEAFYFVGAGTMAADLAPASRRGEAISYWSVGIYGGLAFGPVLGEALLDASNADVVWMVAAGLALVAAILGLATADAVGPEPGGGTLIQRSALAPGVVLFLGLIGLTGFIAFVPLYARDVGLADSRFLFLVYGTLVLVVRIAGARLPDRLGPRRAGTAALLGVATGTVLMASWGTTVGLYVGTIVFASGMSLLYPSLLLLALQSAPDQERASVVGTISVFFDLSQGLGAVIVGTVAELGGYRAGFAAGATLAIVGLLLLHATAAMRAHPTAPMPATEA